MKFIRERYSPAGLLQLFLISSLPSHFWTLLISFRDISWLAERTNMYDALGVVSYGLVFAFCETFFVFIAFALLGCLVSVKWNEATRLTLLNTLVVLLGLWAMFDQTFFLWNFPMPVFLADYLSGSAHPVRVFYGLAVLAVAPSIFLPSLLVIRSERFFRLMKAIHDRLSVLAGFYLSIDIAALIVVIIRNV
jgi:hypothetical protein